MRSIVSVLTCVFLFVGLFYPSVWAREDGWTKYDSRHFVVKYKSAPLDFVKNVSETAEELYDQIPRNLGFLRYQGWAYDQRAEITIYDDQEEYQSHAKNMEWSGGMTNSEHKEIWTYPAQVGFFDTTLPHELGHVIFREFIGNTAVPVWFDEGVAMYQEKAKRWGANKYVIKLLQDGTFLPLNEMTPARLRSEKNVEIINIFYAQAASIVYYMIVELGEGRFENFCRKLSAGVSFEDALRETYGRFHNIKQLPDRWVEYLKSQAEE